MCIRDRAWWPRTYGPEFQVFELYHTKHCHVLHSIGGGTTCRDTQRHIYPGFVDPHRSYLRFPALLAPPHWSLVSRSQTLTPHAGEGLVNCYTRSCTSASYRAPPIRLQRSHITSFIMGVFGQWPDVDKELLRSCHILRLIKWRKNIPTIQLRVLQFTRPSPACGVRVWLRETNWSPPMLYTLQ